MLKCFLPCDFWFQITSSSESPRSVPFFLHHVISSIDVGNGRGIGGLDGVGGSNRRGCHCACEPWLHLHAHLHPCIAALVVLVFLVYHHFRVFVPSFLHDLIHCLKRRWRW